MGDLEQNIKESFLKVKQDFLLLKTQLEKQQEEINKILKEVKELCDKTNKQNQPISTGNQGVRQTDRQTDRHLDTSKINIQNEDLSYNSQEKGISTGNKGIRHSDTFLDTELDTRQTDRHINRQFDRQTDTKNPGTIQTNSNQRQDSAIFRLSKQELKLFLTIYQLEDESIPVTTKILSLKMQLSESCIRDHLSSLLKKKAPITKIKANNHTNLFSIIKEFRALNLKNTLIELYYHSDPSQQTLFHF